MVIFYCLKKEREIKQKSAVYNTCFIILLVTGYYYRDVGIRQSGIPEVRLFGYTRNLPTMPPRDIFQNPWPKSDAFVPPQRNGRGDYYGYYHQAIENERERRRKEFPTSWKIEARDIPKI